MVRLAGRFDQKHAAILGRKFPPHPLLEHQLMDPEGHSLELEDALSVFYGIIARNAEKLITEQGKTFGIVGRDPLLTSGSVFPQAYDERAVDRRCHHAAIAGI
jgi:hypothetical protein